MSCFDFSFCPFLAFACCCVTKCSCSHILLVKLDWIMNKKLCEISIFFGSCAILWSNSKPEILNGIPEKIRVDWETCGDIKREAEQSSKKVLPRALKLQSTIMKMHGRDDERPGSTSHQPVNKTDNKLITSAVPWAEHCLWLPAFHTSVTLLYFHPGLYKQWAGFMIPVLWKNDN